MLSFSKFAVFSVLLSPSLVVASAQGPAVHSKPVGIEKVMAQLTKVKEEERPKMVALFESFVHEWAGLGHLKIESCENDVGVESRKVVDHIKNIFYHLPMTTDLAHFLQTAMNDIQRSKLMYMKRNTVFHNMSEERQNYDQNTLYKAFFLLPPGVLNNDDETYKFYAGYDPLLARFIKASKVLLESSTECLLGRCTDETVKLLSEIKSDTLGKGLDVGNEESVLNAQPSMKAEAALFMMEKNVEIMEKLSQKIKNGTMVSSLEAQVEKKKSECTAVALGLGLGLGLGLPASFALVLFVLFKNGRLSWRSTLDSQA